jgi:DNA polymerase III subunit alpha
MLRDAKPSVFEDVIALVALYRPGPMDLIPTFCARKHGREEVSYPHPLMQEVLQETYGIMVYQEQVMQVAQILGGYTLGGADLLRRAMGKKKLEEMAKHRATFAQGAAQKGIKEPLANEIFDLMEKFAGYGFNKSHAAAYALLAYHTAWAKVHYPAEFVCANMTVAMDDTDKLKVFHDDARAQGLEFEAPDVNQGEYQFIPIKSIAGPPQDNLLPLGGPDAKRKVRGQDIKSIAGPPQDDLLPLGGPDAKRKVRGQDIKKVRYGLGAIKGTGRSAIEAIVASREQDGPFTSLFDLCARVDRARMNKRTVEALIKAGAFDQINPDRASLIASVPVAFEFAESQAAHTQQMGLFDFGDEPSHGASTQEPDMQMAEQPWSIREKLMHEKSALGFYISGHLFDQNEAEIRQFIKTHNADVMENREPQLLAGIVSHWRVINGQRGRVGIFKLDDKTEALEAVMNEEQLNLHKDWLKDDELVIVQVKAQPDRFAGGLRLNVLQVWNLPQARCRFAKFLQIELTEKSPDLNVDQLLGAYPVQQMARGDEAITLGLKVRLMIHRTGAKAELDLGDDGRFYPSEEALALARWLWADGVRVVY